ncbi:MAG: hypothetical protein ABIH65_04085 [Nanoarchaeota archaeon]
MKQKKTYFIYKFTNNPNPHKTYLGLKKLFGVGYIFDKKHPNASKKLTRADIRKLFTKDMKEGKFDRVIVDISYGKGRFMKEEIALAKKLKIPVKGVNINKMLKVRINN